MIPSSSEDASPSLPAMSDNCLTAHDSTTARNSDITKCSTPDLGVKLNRLPGCISCGQDETSNDQNCFRFLSLPLEIRNMIYRLLTVAPKTLQLAIDVVGVANRGIKRPTYHVRMDVEVFLMSRQIRSEISCVFYTENTFDIRPWSASPANSSHRLKVDIRFMRRCCFHLEDGPRHHTNSVWVFADIMTIARSDQQGYKWQHFLIEVAYHKGFRHDTIVWCLSRLASLRNLKECHIEGFGATLEPGFRSLRRLMMSDKEATISDTRMFRTIDALEAWANTQPWMTEKFEGTSEDAEKAYNARTRRLYSILELPCPLHLQEDER